MPRILVVYFSRSGHTRQLAEALASALSADIEPIGEDGERGGILQYLRSAWEALNAKPVAIRPSAKVVGDYDAVVLGTPVWASRMSSPMRAYIAAHASEFRQIALFCTLGGSGAEKTMRGMSELCGKQPLATLAVTEGELRSGKWKDRLGAFVAAVSAELKK